MAIRYITIIHVHSSIRSYTHIIPYLYCIPLLQYLVSSRPLEDLGKCIAKLTGQCICMCTL